ncbi:MAG TPA: FecR domain-containing protein [Novosphingobium sp.]|nr:FecR domain-containing protein [Novosphingobium sp.]
MALAPGMAHAGEPAVTRAEGPRPEIRYTVIHGDTLWHFAATWLVGVSAADELQRLNHIPEPRHMPIGLVLRIPVDLLREEASVAVVEAFSGPVAILRGGHSEPPRIGMQIGEGTGLATGANAFITLRLADRTAVSVPSQSSVSLARLRRQLLTGTLTRQVDVGAGRLHATVTPMQDPASSFRVKTPLTVSAVRGTDFRIEFDDKGLAATTVSTGKVAVGSGPAPRPEASALVPAGFGQATTPSGSSGLVKLLPAPELAAADKPQTGGTLAFAVAPVAGAVQYRAQLARDAGMLDVVEESRAAAPLLRLPPVADGHYTLRLSAVDAQGLEGFTRTYPVERQLRPVTLHMEQLGRGQRLAFRFGWTGGVAGASTWHFQLFRSQSGELPLIDRAAIADAATEVPALPPGDYAWRVGEENGTDADWSPPQRFHIVAGR